MIDYDKDLEKTEQLFALLQGKVPDDCTIARGHIPKLSPDQAWTVIWWLGNQYDWKPSDKVERCDVCGDLYHTYCGGGCLDFGRAPYMFCDNCRDGEEYAKKARSRLNPNKEERKEFMEAFNR